MIYDGFDDKEDICTQFYIDDFEGEVICAVYNMEGYEGTAVVIYHHDEKVYFVLGSHCSCYGLEDCWSPTEYKSYEEFLKCFDNYGANYIAPYKDQIIMAVLNLFNKPDIKNTSTIEI